MICGEANFVNNNKLYYWNMQPNIFFSIRTLFWLLLFLSTREHINTRKKIIARFVNVTISRAPPINIASKKNYNFLKTQQKIYTTPINGKSKKWKTHKHKQRRKNGK